MTEQQNIIEKLNEAAKNIGAVKKDGNNSFQKYRFQSETAIKSAVEAAIETVGIRIIPDYEVTNQYDKPGKNNVNHFVDVMGTFTITDGVDQIKGTMPGSGQDTGEKAMAKACTSAQKYFYKQLFNITDKEEDPDADNSDTTFVKQSKPRTQSTPAPINAKQKASLDELFDSMAQITSKPIIEVKQGYLSLVGADSVDALNNHVANKLIEIVSSQLIKQQDKIKQEA